MYALQLAHSSFVGYSRQNDEKVEGLRICEVCHEEGSGRVFEVEWNGRCWICAGESVAIGGTSSENRGGEAQRPELR